jgi:fumarate hydratase subunit beta
MKKITTPLDDAAVLNLKAGESVLISGIIYTARDSAHKRMVDSLKKQEPLPIDIKGQIIYYAGPAPAKPGYPIGPIGPTTSGRMDAFTPLMLEKGLKGMVGKGNRSKDVIEAMKKYKAVYFAAIGGAAALLAKRVKSARVVAYDDLGAEAITELVVDELPVVVVNDAFGNDLYEEGIKQYRQA